MRLLDHDTGYDVICARMWNTTVCLILGDFLDSTVGKLSYKKIIEPCYRFDVDILPEFCASWLVMLKGLTQL